MVGAVRQWRVPITEIDRMIHEVPWTRLVLMGAYIHAASGRDGDKEESRMLSVGEIDDLLSE